MTSLYLFDNNRGSLVEVEVGDPVLRGLFCFVLFFRLSCRMVLRNLFLKASVDQLESLWTAYLHAFIIKCSR